jgi:hypothetical protein
MSKGSETNMSDICTPMFTAALLTIANKWKKPKCPLTDEWVKKMWHLYTMECYSAIKRERNPLICDMVGTGDHYLKLNKTGMAELGNAYL